MDKCRLYPESRVHRMSDEVLEQLVKGYMTTHQPIYTFGWQGGEPTLMGVAFFRKVTRLQEIYGRPGDRVANGLQTNATLITEELAEHFSRYRFLLGCSLDGPPDIHNRFRRTASGAPTHNRVLKGIETLKRHQVELNILTLVSKANVDKPRRIYRYLLDQGFAFHQYIPCVEFGNGKMEMPFSINGEEWGSFLCGIFDQWYQQDRHRVSIRLFDSILRRMIEGSPTVCHMDRNCCQYLVVEYNGDVYPCDFFVEAPLKLGNIMVDSWAELLASKTYREFGTRKALWNKACNSCDHLDLCNGDCLKHRVYNGNSPRNLSYLCAGWKRFFDYTRERFEIAAKEIRKEYIHRISPSQQKSAPGRNDPCPCGSGRKYKKCCGTR